MGYSDYSAAKDAAELARQRREARASDAKWPKHFPRHECPRDHGARYLRYREGTSCDEATVMMFAEDVNLWRKACPNWTAERITQAIMDRGYYHRWGYMWGLRIAERLLGSKEAVA